MKLRILSLILTVIVFTGCTNDKPHPETRSISISPMAIIDHRTNNSIEVASQLEKRKLQVQHHLKGGNVYIECYVNQFRFVEEKKKKKEGEGHIVLYINGKKHDKISTAAFVIKGLSSGINKIKVELVHNDSSSYQLAKEFTVNIK
ncbi:hypothetical protein LCL95_02720 [Bacillus timonensis]|nr:hypothetical protein [Bacillus timonensis]